MQQPTKMAADVGRDQRPFSWPDPPMPARFFTEEGFAKYSMSSPPLMEVLQKIPKCKLRGEAHPLQYQPLLERLPLKGKAARDLEGLETLKPGFNYPHYSQMTEGLMKYFHFLKTKYGIKGERVVSEQEAKQHGQWVLFQKQVLKEQEEFQIFAKQVAMASADDFARFLPGAEENIAKCLEANRRRVLGYPQLYRMNQTVGLKADPVLPSDPQLTLLQPPKYQSDVRLLHWRNFKNDNQQYLCEVGNTSSSLEMQEDTSSLSSEGCPEGVDIVISMDALTSLVDNHQLENYPHQWEIPFTVKTTQTANGKLQKTVSLEDPFMAHNYHPNTANNLLACNLMKEHLIKEGAQMILNRKKSGTHDQTMNFRRRNCVARARAVSREESEPIPVVSLQQDDDDPFGSNTDDITALETLGSGSFFSYTKHDVKDNVKQSRDRTPASKFQAIQFVKSGLTLHDEKKALLDSLDMEPPKLPLKEKEGSSTICQQVSKDDSVEQGSGIGVEANSQNDTYTEIDGNVKVADAVASEPPDQHRKGIAPFIDQEPQGGDTGSSSPDQELQEGGDSDVGTAEQVLGGKGNQTSGGLGEETGIERNMVQGETTASIGDYTEPTENNKPPQEISSSDFITSGGRAEQLTSHGESAEYRSSSTLGKVDTTEAEEKVERQNSKESEEDIFAEKETDLVMDTSALDDAMRSCLAINGCGRPSSGEEPLEQGTETGGMAQRVTRGMARNKGEKATGESDATCPMSPPLEVQGRAIGSIEKRATRSAVKKGGDGANLGSKTRSLSTSGEEERASAKRTRSGRLVGNIAATEDQKGSPASGKKSSSTVMDKDALGAKRTRSGRIIQDKTLGKAVDGKSAAIVSVEDDETVQAKRTRSGRVIGDEAKERTQVKSGGKNESSPTSVKGTGSVRLTPLSDEEMMVTKETKTGSGIGSSAPEKKEASEGKRTTRSGKIIGTTPKSNEDKKGPEKMEEEEPLIVVRRATRRRSARSGRVIGTRNTKGDANNLQDNVAATGDSAKGVESLSMEGGVEAVGDGLKQKKTYDDQIIEAVSVGGSGQHQQAVGGEMRVAMSSDSESGLKIDCSLGEVNMSEDNDSTSKVGSSESRNSQSVDNLNRDVRDEVPVVSMGSTKSTVGIGLPHDSSSDNELHMDVDMPDDGLVKGPSAESRPTDIIRGDIGRTHSGPLLIPHEETSKIDSTTMGIVESTERTVSKVEERSIDSDGEQLISHEARSVRGTSLTETNDVIASEDDACRKRLAMKPTLPDSLQHQLNLPGDSSQSEQELSIDLGEEFDGPHSRGTNFDKKGKEKSPPKMRLRKQRTGELKAGGTAETDPQKAETANPASTPLLDNILKLQKKLIASKKGVEKEEKTTPNPSKKVPQTPGSVFDSIFKDQRKLFKMKSEENVPAEPRPKKGGEETGRADVLGQIMMEERADTSLWKIGKLRMCLRGGIDGIYWDYKAKKNKAASVYAKVEQQPWFGFEQVSMGEISRLWLRAALFPESAVLRGRIHCHSSELMKLEVLNINNIGAWTQFQPAYAVKVLHNIFNKLLTLSDGSYLLMHHAGGPQAFIYSTVEEATAHRFIIYDLHAEHQKATLHNSPPAEIPWAPLDPNLKLPRSDIWQIPCLFPPPPYVKQHEYCHSRQFNPYEGLGEPRKRNKKKKKKKNASEGQAKQEAKSDQPQKSPPEGPTKPGAKMYKPQKSPPEDQTKPGAKMYKPQKSLPEGQAKPGAKMYKPQKSPPEGQTKPGAKMYKPQKSPPEGQTKPGAKMYKPQESPPEGQAKRGAKTNQQTNTEGQAKTGEKANQQRPGPKKK